MTERDFSVLPDPGKFQAGFETYLSPYTYRYGSDEMRTIWSQNNFWSKARDVWVAVAQEQAEAGLVTQQQLDDLIANRDQLSVERIWQWERDRKHGLGHDVMAAVREFSEVAPLGGEILHNGMTSEDVLSNVEVDQIHESLEIILNKTDSTLFAFADRVEETKGLVCLGFTHLQAAEPTTYGYRFAKYAQDLLAARFATGMLMDLITAKGMKGAVGTSASFKDLLSGKGIDARQFETRVMGRLGLKVATVTDQTYPRQGLLWVSTILGGIGQSLHRFALDVQTLQSFGIDEVSEPRRKGQVGSSAMPFKRNPITAENIDSVGETLPGYYVSAWITSSFATLERTLRDSAGKRSWLPESFLAVDEMLTKSERLIRGLEIHKSAVKRNLDRHAPFAALEIIMGRLVNAGMDRQRVHEKFVGFSEDSVEAIREGRANPMKDIILNDSEILRYLSKGVLEDGFEEIYSHVGNVEERCKELIREINIETGRVVSG